MSKQGLSAKQVHHVKPDATKRLEIAAGPPGGLYLVVQPSGAKTWALRYRWLGKPAKLTFKAYPEMGLAAARAEAVAALEKLANGENPAAAYVVENRRPNSAEQVAEEWLAREVRPCTRTWREVERLLRREILPTCKHKLITQIRRTEILQLLDATVDRGVPVLANRVLSICKRWLRWAVVRGYIETSPAADIDPPAEEKGRERVLSEDELAQVWTAAIALEYPYGPLLQVLILSAQRRGEVAGMRWQDVDLDKKLWTLPAEQTKPGRIHDVPLSPAVVAILRGLPRFTGPLVFSTRGGTVAVSGFSKFKWRLDAEILKRRTKGKPVSPFTVHDFRRTAATWMAGASVPPHVLSALLNHSPGSAQGVTAIYNRFRYLEERRDALEQWAKHVTGLAKQKRRAS